LAEALVGNVVGTMVGPVAEELVKNGNRVTIPVIDRVINPVRLWNAGTTIWLDSRLLKLPGEHFG